MSASALVKRPGKEVLNLTVAEGARENPWINTRAKKLMIDIIYQCLSEALVTGTVSITFLCIRDCLKKKNQPPRSMILQRTFRQEGPNALPILMVGNNPRNDICYITLVMPTDAKVLLMSFFEQQKEKDMFRYVMEPKVVTPQMLQEIHDQDDTDDDSVSEELCELTPIDETVAILYLTEVRSSGGEITRNTAEALVRQHFPEKDWNLAGDLVEVMLNDGYLKRNPEGSIVKLTQKANDLLAEEEVRTTASLLSMSETPQPEAKHIVSAEEIEVRKLLTLRNRIKEVQGKLTAAEEQNAKVEQTLIPLRAKDKAVQTEMAELDKNATSHEKLVEKHRRLAVDLRNSLITKRNEQLKIQAQIRENSEKANTETATIKAELEELLKEQRKLLTEV